MEILIKIQKLTNLELYLHKTPFNSRFNGNKIYNKLMENTKLKNLEVFYYYNRHKNYD